MSGYALGTEVTELTLKGWSLPVIPNRGPHVPSEAVALWFRLLLALEAAVDEEEEEEEDDVTEVAVWTEAGVVEGEASRSPDSILSGNVLSCVTSLLVHP